MMKGQVDLGSIEIQNDMTYEIPLHISPSELPFLFSLLPQGAKHGEDK